MSKKKQISIFKKCVNGHDTVDEEDFIYDSYNRMNCRKCVSETQAKKAKKRSAF